MGMEFTKHFYDALHEYKKVFMDVFGIDESLIDDESIIVVLMAREIERMKETQKLKDLVYHNKNA